MRWTELCKAERLLEQQETEKNQKVTKVLEGRRKPPDKYIIRELTRGAKHAEFHG